MSTGFTSSVDTDEGTLSTIRRGLAVAPVLRNGLWFTFFLAAMGSGGRVVVPILIQQAIDKGIVGQTTGEPVDIALVTRLAVIGAIAVFSLSILVEVGQGRYSSTRAVERSDVMSNGIGVATGVIAAGVCYLAWSGCAALVRGLRRS